MTPARRIGVVASLAVRASAVALLGVRLARHTAPPLRAAPPCASDEASITVVIPARDEAARLPAAIASVIDEPEVAEVLVVDDDSRDATVEVARACGASVVRVGPPPSGWTGKPWALHQGLARAATDWVVLLDADCRADPRLPAALVRRLGDDRAVLLSAAARVRPASSTTTGVHASLLANLVGRFGPPGVVHGPGAHARTLISGQCLVARRADALRWRGWASVADSTIEDVALARRLVRSGQRVAWVDGTALLAVEPYASATATVTGWGRSIGLAGAAPVSSRVFDVVVSAIAMPWPLLRVVLRRSDAVDLVAVALRVGLLVGLGRAFERRPAGFWLSPLADPVAVGVLVVDLARRSESWRGRTVPRAAARGSVTRRRRNRRGGTVGQTGTAIRPRS